MAAEGVAVVRPGDVLAGKYRIDKVLGAGGMGVVVAAHHMHLDERVAIKFLLPEAMTNPEAVARFAREARAAVKIKSEHVARVTDVGTLETGAPYMVMEYLEGSDLAAWVQRNGALPIEQAVGFVLQACDAIADAHSLGIIHRDLKPANLFCIRRNDGQFSIKVLDFGISKMTGFSASGPDLGMTKTAAIMGSPYYMSPEQVQSSKDVDPRSDIWAIGVILYELLVGHVPFNGDAIAELILKIMTAPTPSLRAFRPDVPERLEAVIARCLQKARPDRYQNVAELAIALAEFAPRDARSTIERISRVIQASGLATSALVPPPASDRVPGVASASRPPAASSGAPAATAASWGNTNPAASRKTPALAIVATGGVAITLAAVALGVIAFKRGSAPSPSASVAAASAAPPPASVAVPVALTPEPVPGASREPTPIVSVAPAGPSSASGADTATAKPVVRSRAVTSITTKRPSTPASTAAVTRVSCDPPYTIDAAGHRQYKPECVK